MINKTRTFLAILLLIFLFVFSYVMYPGLFEEEIELTEEEQIIERRQRDISEMDQRYFDRGQCSSIRNAELRRECNEQPSSDPEVEE